MRETLDRAIREIEKLEGGEMPQGEVGEFDFEGSAAKAELMDELRFRGVKESEIDELADLIIAEGAKIASS
jgi:hypothetical protein